MSPVIHRRAGTTGLNTFVLNLRVAANNASAVSCLSLAQSYQLPSTQAVMIMLLLMTRLNSRIMASLRGASAI